MFNATGERFPKFLFWLVRYGLTIVMLVSFTVGAVAEFYNPLELPWWALFFGWLLMLFPITVACLGFCLPKSKVLRCLDRYASKPVAEIQYAHDVAGDK